MGGFNQFTLPDGYRAVTKHLPDGRPVTVFEPDTAASSSDKSNLGIADLVSLRLISVRACHDRDIRFVEAMNTFYRFDSDTDTADDSLSVIQPVDATDTGRWLAIQNPTLRPLCLGAAQQLTISATGSVTVGVGSYYTVETYNSGATSNLDTINGGVEGQIIYLRALNVAHVVTVRNGIGNIQNLGTDYVYANTDQVMVLLKLSSNWVLVSKS